MKHFELIEIEEQPNGATYIWLNRPELHNAFNAQLIAELSQCFDALEQNENTRVVILAGRGKNFSAGADLNWMKAARHFSSEENQQDAMKLATMLHKLAHLRQPTIARVHGAALGGGLGLASACDICIASEKAMFATSEVRLGLAPSTISPYVIRAIGARQASRYFLTAERLSAQQAKAIGLAHEVYSAEALDTGIQQIIEQLLLGSPQAQTASKQLIDTVAEQELTPELMQQTATHIARLRLGEEAQEGLSAFLEKRTPHWCA